MGINLVKEKFHSLITSAVVILTLSGCEAFTAEDGVWKLGHPHCMRPVTNKASSISEIKLPDVCMKQTGGAKMKLFARNMLYLREGKRYQQCCDNFLRISVAFKLQMVGTVLTYVFFVFLITCILKAIAL